ADGATRARDENRRASKGLRHQLEIDPRRRSPQEVLHIDLSDGVHRYASSHDLRDARDGQAACSLALRDADQSPQCSTIGRRQREKHNRDPVPPDNSLKIGTATEHWQAEEALTIR